jgi:hypothetical protein
MHGGVAFRELVEAHHDLAIVQPSDNVRCRYLGSIKQSARLTHCSAAQRLSLEGKKSVL